MGFAEDMDVKRPDDLDMQILRNVHATAGRSKKLVGELKNLKAKMYGIENNLKHLWCDERVECEKCVVWKVSHSVCVKW